MRILTFIFSLLLTTSAFAAVTHDCGSLNNIGNLVGTTKSFGNFKVAYVSTEEPAVAPDHILVIVYDKELGYSCTAISERIDQGFGLVKMESLKSIGYNAKTGRLMRISVVAPAEGGKPGKAEVVKFRVDSWIGLVTIN